MTSRRMLLGESRTVGAFTMSVWGLGEAACERGAKRKLKELLNGEGDSPGTLDALGSV